MGFKLYVAVRDNCPYTGPTRWVFLTLADLAGDANQRVDFGRGYRVAKLAYYAGVYERTWQRACVKLAADGYLTAERRYVKHKQEPNHYQLHIPREWFGPDQSDAKPNPKRPKKGQIMTSQSRRQPRPDPRTPDLAPAAAANEPPPPDVPGVGDGRSPAGAAQEAQTARADASASADALDLALYEPLPGRWHRIAAQLAAAMPVQTYQTLFGGARLYAPASDLLPSNAAHLLVCRNRSAWRLAITSSGIGELARAVAALGFAITVLPIPPQAVKETSDPHDNRSRNTVETPLAAQTEAGRAAAD